MTVVDIDFIARLLDLVERSGVAELDLTLDGARLRVVKAQGTAPPVQAVTPMPDATVEAPSALPEPGAAPAKALHAVKAGFPGTFYRAPAPGSPPFASVGDTVADGRQLAIVEAMKTMNPVEADVSGTLVRIAVEDAQAVEAGDVLFEIEPHG